MDFLTIIELISVVFSLIFVVLAMRENAWCWICGIIGSALGVYLMIEYKYYAEAFLYFFYVVFGFYGWYKWLNKQEDKPIKISKWGIRPHIISIIIGAVVSVLVAFGLSKYSDSDYPFLDSPTTVFGLIASYMEANKILSHWIFWIVLNAATIGLYTLKGMTIYPWLYFLYFILSIVGYFEWKKRLVTTKEKVMVGNS